MCNRISFPPFQSLCGHTTPVECVRFGHTEELVCAGSQSGALKIWDLEAARLVRTLTGHKAGLTCVDFHPYGERLFTFFYKKRTVFSHYTM